MSSSEIFLSITIRQSSIYMTCGVIGKKAEAFFIRWLAEYFPDEN